MNRKTIFLTITFMSILLFGCNNASEQKDINPENNVSMLSDTLKHHLETQDSLYKELVQKVDTLTTELNDAKHDVAMLNSTIEDKKSQSRIWVIISIIVGCLALFVALVVGWCTRRDLDKEGVVATTNGLLRNLEFNKDFRERIQMFMNNHGSASSSLSNYNVKLLEKRIAELEEKIGNQNSISKMERKEQNPIPPHHLEVQEKKQTSSMRHLYAKINNDIYFTQVFESNQDGTCVFIIDLKTDNSGEFDIISLGKIQQRNGWECVIDYSGDCTVSEAKMVNTIQKGKCERSTDGTSWKVVKNLQIKLTK